MGRKQKHVHAIMIECCIRKNKTIHQLLKMKPHFIKNQIITNQIKFILHKQNNN